MPEDIDPPEPTEPPEPLSPEKEKALSEKVGEICTNLIGPKTGEFCKNFIEQAGLSLSREPDISVLPEPKFGPDGKIDGGQITITIKF